MMKINEGNINEENLERIEEWASKNKESITHHGVELRIALSIEHLAQAVSRGSAALEKIADLFQKEEK